MEEVVEQDGGGRWKEGMEGREGMEGGRDKGGRA